MESVKAGAAAVVGGLAATVPLAVASPGPTGLLGLAASAASCLLFGVTYRYAVRKENVGNPQLRGGVVAAFALVRALAAADALYASSDGISIDLIGSAALYAGQSMLTFMFASSAVEAAVQQGLVKRFGEAPEAEASAEDTSSQTQ